jgi:hypothetical protein
MWCRRQMRGSDTSWDRRSLKMLAVGRLPRKRVSGEESLAKKYLCGSHIYAYRVS